MHVSKLQLLSQSCKEVTAGVIVFNQGFRKSNDVSHVCGMRMCKIQFGKRLLPFCLQSMHSRSLHLGLHQMFNSSFMGH